MIFLPVLGFYTIRIEKCFLRRAQGVFSFGVLPSMNRGVSLGVGAGENDTIGQAFFFFSFEGRGFNSQSFSILL